MTKIEELEQKLNEWFKTVSKEEMIKILKEEGFEVIDKESKKEGKWKPKNGETFWFRNVRGESESYTHKDFFNSDEWLINNLPIFPTKEECERYWHFMDTVKEKSYEFTTDEWEDVTLEKYHIVCDYGYDIKKFIIQMNYQYKVLGTIYFKTEEDAKYIIDNFKDELMEYWI